MRLVAIVLFAILATAMGTQKKPQEMSESNDSLVNEFFSAARQQVKLNTRLNRRLLCHSAEKAIVYYRAKTWGYQDDLGEYRSPTYYPERKKNACAYKRWVANNWQGIAREYAKEVADLLLKPELAICKMFGSYCSQAIAVAKCESGDRDGSLSFHATRASNGQYKGMFQMGSSERRIYGHGSTTIEQARAAYAYFTASGKDWSPWSCKP